MYPMFFDPSNIFLQPALEYMKMQVLKFYPKFNSFNP